jgi:hypothetical protein
MTVPSKIKCVVSRKAIAMSVLYALTLNAPILFPAAVKKSELMVQRNEVAIAALSPTTPESKLLTDLVASFDRS